MQLVLDDQAGWRNNTFTLLVEAEQFPGLRTPSHHGELVNGADHDRGTHLVDVLVNHMYRQTCASRVTAL